MSPCPVTVYAVVNELRILASDCSFKDVLFRVDTRLELPRGTLLEYEHKSTVKELIKGLVVSVLPVRSFVPLRVARPPT